MSASTKNKEAIRDGIDLSQVVELQDVYVSSADCSRETSVPVGSLLAQMSRKAEAWFDPDESVVQVIAGFRLDGFIPSKENEEVTEGGNEVAHVEASFVLRYGVPSGTKVTKNALAEFASQNGVFNAWPYWREYLHATTARMGLPGFVCPVLRIGAGRERAKPTVTKKRAKTARSKSE